MKETVHLEGMKEIADRLNAMGKEGNRIARKALTSGADIMKTEIARRVPVGSQGRHYGKKEEFGQQLKDSIKVRIKETPKGWSSTIGPTKISRAQQLKQMRRSKVKGGAIPQDWKPAMIRGPESIAWWLEYGTKTHYLGAKSSRRVVGGKTRSGVWHYRGRRVTLEERRHGAYHPGAKPHPFMGPAFDAKKNESLKAITETIRQGLGL